MYALEVMDGHCIYVVGIEYNGVPLPASPQLHIQGNHVGNLELATRGVFTPQKLADAAHQSYGCRELVLKHFPATTTNLHALLCRLLVKVHAPFPGLFFPLLAAAAAQLVWSD